MGNSASPVRLDIDDRTAGRQPDASWAVEDLQRYALVQHEIALQMRGVVGEVARRTAVHVHRLGRALILIKQNIGGRGWMAWRKRHGLSNGTVDRAMALYKAVPSEADLEGLSIQRAYRKFGVTPTKRPQLARSAVAASGTADSNRPSSTSPASVGPEVPPSVQPTVALVRPIELLDAALESIESDRVRANAEQLEVAERRLSDQLERLRRLRATLPAAHAG